MGKGYKTVDKKNAKDSPTSEKVLSLTHQEANANQTPLKSYFVPVWAARGQDM